MEKTDEYTKQNEELWDSRAETYDKRFGFTRWTQKKLVSILELGENPYFLDIGCGTGWAVRYAANLTNGRGEFYGIDNSSEMIKKVEASSSSYKNIHFYKANAESLPFGNNFFDLIISTNAFHHFASPDKVLKEAYRVLKPKGRIYIFDVTADNFMIRILDRLSKKIEQGHVKIYSTREYQTLFENSGLQYMGHKSVIVSMKTHIGEKVSQ